jgi:hypothetical protein
MCPENRDRRTSVTQWSPNTEHQCAGAVAPAQWRRRWWRWFGAGGATMYHGI